jgi:phenylacetate-CoA ligase
MLPPGLHERLAGTAYRRVQLVRRAMQPALRPAYASYRAGLEFRRATESWSAERRAEWQLARLQQVVRHAYDTTPFYRDRLDAVGFDPRDQFGFDSYAALPVLEREDVREAGERMLSRSVPRSQLRVDSTGGSTGTPTRLWKGPEERGWAESGTEYFMRRIGLRPGSRLAYLWGHHLDATVRAGWRDWLTDHVNAARWYDCFRLDPEILERYDRDLRRWRPRGMIAYANALAALARVVNARGDRPNYPRQAFVTGAEKLHAHDRELVERAFGRPVHERYGSRDVGLIGFQVDPASTHDFSVDWARVLVEPDTSADTTDGTAGVLITKLRADGMPMLRYRVGDLARFPAGSRPGSPALLLHEVLGRDMDRVWLPNGRWIHPAVVPHLMKDYPVRDFHLHQRIDYSVLVRITPAAGYGDATEAALRSMLQSNLPGIPISFAVTSSIERTRANKWRPVTSDVTAPVKTVR